MAIDNVTPHKNESSYNSTTTPLGSNASFTGYFEDVSNYAAINVIIFADTISASNGFEFQWSGDGVNIDRSEGSNVKANTGRAFSICPRAKYFRIKYTNGVTAQSTFRLNVTYRGEGTGLISRPLNQALDTSNFAQSVRAVVNTENSLSPGNFENVKSKSGRLLVSQELSAPASTTVVVQSAFSSVADTTGVDTIYTITNGKTLTIQRLTAGSEEETGGSVVELFEDPNGNLTGMVRIEMLFVNGTSTPVDIGQDFVGNGTRRIVMRRRGYTASSREIFGRWQGFEA